MNMTVRPRHLGIISPLALLLLSGCNFTSTPLVERHVTLEVPMTPETILVARSENGAITAAERPGETMTVKAVIRARTQERADATEIVAEQSPDGGLLLHAKWPEKREGNEGCIFDLAVPACASIELRSSNGRLTLTGLSGTALLRSSNGRIAIDGFTGPISADSSNGAIEVTGATSNVRASSSNGRLTVTLADSNPGPVDLSTSNGSIDLTVGQSFVGLLSARTSNGSVTISGPGIEVTQQRKTTASARFGPEADAAASDLRTSNGRITVKSATQGG